MADEQEPPKRIASADPDDDLTSDQIIRKQIELERGVRKRGISESTRSNRRKQISILATRMGVVPPQIRKQQLPLNNLTANEYNRYVRERYTPLYPIHRSFASRAYGIRNITGRTAVETSNRLKRGNKKIKRKKGRKKKSRV